MTTIADQNGPVTVGIDTHRDVHVAAVLDARGGLLGVESFPSTSSGHRQLATWAERFGAVTAAGVEGTGAWGAGLTRHLATRGWDVLEVDRPDRAARRRRGKSDTLDAEAAARAVQAGTATGTPKARTGAVEAIRALRVARRSAMKARCQAANQLHSLTSTAPDELRDTLRKLNRRELVKTAAAFRPSAATTALAATKTALRSIARRYQSLDAEIVELDGLLAELIATTAPGLLDHFGVGADVAGQLLVTAGDNPHRLENESSFAHLCGVAPIPASSGRTDRHRLNRGGDRQANAALYTVVVCRLRWHQPTRDYAERRRARGHSTKDIIRCLKRYVARELHHELTKIRLADL